MEDEGGKMSLDLVFLFAVVVVGRLILPDIVIFSAVRAYNNCLIALRYFSW